MMRPLILVVVVFVAGCATTPGMQADAVWMGSTPRAQAFNHYLAGVIYLKNGRFEDAAASWRHVVELTPQSTSVAIELVQLYTSLQEHDEARQVCEMLVGRNPDDATLWILLGVINRRLERYEAMSEAFERATTLSAKGPLNFESLLLAEEVERANDLVAAIEIYEQLVALHPDSARLHYMLGLSLARIEDSETARREAERALELEPGLVDARYLLGVVLLGLGEDEGAVDAFRRVLTANPKQAGLRQNLAGALARVGETEEAVRVLAGLIEDGEGDPVHHVARLFLLVSSGRHEEANALGLPADAPIFGTLLRALARRGLEKPYRSLVDTLDEVDGDVDLECNEFLNEMVYLFGAEKAAGFFVDAMAALQDEGAGSERVALIRARGLMSLERHADAEPVLLASLEAHGSDKWLHYYLATVYEELGRFSEAETHLESCLDLEPENAEVMNFLAYMYAEEDVKLDRAEELLLKALAIDPGNGFYLDSLGWVHYRKGHAQKAINLIRQAIVVMTTDDAILRDHLGDAYRLNGDLEKALAEWRRASRLDPDLEGIQEKIDRYSGE
jgi:tetratricopeptide (TPR) repeat protein